MPDIHLEMAMAIYNILSINGNVASVAVFLDMYQVLQKFCYTFNFR